jgi:citronellol/citronellal dehydrogenase
MNLQGKTALITGATRGIGRAIALCLAQQGVNIVVTGKTVTPHPKLSGTIYSVAQEIEALGVKALPLPLDIRQVDSIDMVVNKTVQHFGGIDILINNASAINMASHLAITPKKFDLMFGVNVRGTFFSTHACIPHLRKSDNPHILTLAPPLAMQAHWFKAHLAYTM